MYTLSVRCIPDYIIHEDANHGIALPAPSVMPNGPATTMALPPAWGARLACLLVTRMTAPVPVIHIAGDNPVVLILTLG